MIKNFGFIILVVCLLVMGSVLISCGGGAGGGDKPTVFSGSFWKDTSNVLGSNTVLFNIGIPEEYQSRAATGSGDHEISGVVKDGNKTIQLTGTYNPVIGSYNLSAATVVNGKDVRYAISGTIDPNDPRYFNADGIKVGMLVKDADWNAYLYPVTETSGTIGGTPEISTGGIPPEFLGNWQSDPIYHDDTKCNNYISFIASPYYLMVEDTYDYSNGNILSFPAMEYTVLSCTPTETAGLYELIVVQPIYVVGTISDGFAPSQLTVDDVNTAFLQYLETHDPDYSEYAGSLKRCGTLGDYEENNGEQYKYFIQNNTQAGDMKSFLSDDKKNEFQNAYLPNYCMTHGFQPISTYVKLDAQMDGQDFLLDQYYDETGYAFLTLQELDSLTLTQDTIVCKRQL